MSELKGSCKYCGQINVIEMKDYSSDEEKNAEATYVCNCEEAATARKVKKASQMIKEIFQTEAEGSGISALTDEQIEILHKAAESVGNNLLLSVTVCYRNGVKALVKSNGKAEIEIQRTDTSVHKESASDEMR